jgi:hypothetical protein
MAKTLKLVLLFLIIMLDKSWCQHGIGLESIKNQKYLEFYYKEPFDCENLSDSNINTFTDRICANLALQKSDSILTLYYDSLKIELKKFGGDSLIQVYDKYQKEWRNYRDKHVDVFYENLSKSSEYKTNLFWVAYMDEMKKMIDFKTDELKILFNFYRKENENK